MLQKAVIRPDIALVICCDLLPKWLRVMVRVRAGARECTSCTFLLCFIRVLMGNCDFANQYD